MGKSNREILHELLDDLPNICQDFLFETATEKAMSTRIAYARELNEFFRYLGSFHPDFCEKINKDITVDDLTKITPQDVSRYLNLYLNDDHAERTTARKKAAISSFFSYLIANRLTNYNPVSGSAKVKIHTKDVIYLNIEEQNTLLNCIQYGTGFTGRSLTMQQKNKTRDFALVTLLLDTGMRVSEIQKADVADINLDDCYIIVIRKGGNGATIYFSDEAAQYLRDYLDERSTLYELNDKDPLFSSRNNDRMTVRAIEYMVKRYAITALPGKGQQISPHKLRSSYAMEYYAIDNDLLGLSKKLGHKNIATTNIYAQATEKQLRDSRNAMSAKRNQGSDD